MGASNAYQIEWFNAFTGELIEIMPIESNLWGRVELNYPGILSGDFKSPMLFFRISPIDQSIYAVPDEAVVKPSPENKLQVDHSLFAVQRTNWN